MGKAAELLGMRVNEFWILIQELGIKYSIMDEEEVEEELDAYKRVFKSSALHITDHSAG